MDSLEPRLKRCRSCGACSETMSKCQTCKKDYKIKWYYCSKPCQVSDWPRHKEYHKSLDKHKVDPGHHLRHALDSLALREDGVAAEASRSDETRRQRHDGSLTSGV
mmetsp:Transcript_60925/g.127712  ORF Transcript_60925/g.127712 Transcript_60925/m.127712 type:complete len:106 (-) Transcript_60925:75-392(-)